MKSVGAIQWIAILGTAIIFGATVAWAASDSDIQTFREASISLTALSDKLNLMIGIVGAAATIVAAAAGFLVVQVMAINRTQTALDYQLKELRLLLSNLLRRYYPDYPDENLKRR